MALLFIALALSGCTSMKITELDPNTGLFPSTKEATVTLSKPLDIDKIKSLVLVHNSDFEKGQMVNIGYFDEVINTDDLEVLIVQNNLGDKVPSIKDKIGVNNAAKYYKFFLWFRYDSRGSGTQEYAQFILTDPLTLEDYFIAETHLDYLWAGVNDQNNWYPMYNSFIKYIKENSKTYK